MVLQMAGGLAAPAIKLEAASEQTHRVTAGGTSPSILRDLYDGSLKSCPYLFRLLSAFSNPRDAVCINLGRLLPRCAVFDSPLLKPVSIFLSLFIEATMYAENTKPSKGYHALKLAAFTWLRKSAAPCTPGPRLLAAADMTCPGTLSNRYGR